MALGAGQISNYFVGATIPRRIGNASPNIAPYEVFPCADGQMILACANQLQFEALCRAVGRPQWVDDERFRNNAARVAHQPELHDLLAAVFSEQGQSEWEEILSVAGVPCGPINDYARALAHPQARHHGTRVELPHALGSSVPGVASPLRFSATPVEYRSAPPLLGQHAFGTGRALESGRRGDGPPGIRGRDRNRARGGARLTRQRPKSALFRIDSEIAQAYSRSWTPSR